MYLSSCDDSTMRRQPRGHEPLGGGISEKEDVGKIDPHVYSISRRNTSLAAYVAGASLQKE